MAQDAASVGLYDPRDRLDCGVGATAAALAPDADGEKADDPPERGGLGLDKAPVAFLKEEAEKVEPTREANGAEEEGAPDPSVARAFPLDFGFDPPLD